MDTDEIEKQLVEFGFDQYRAKKAIKAVQGSGGLQAALDWLESHQDSGEEEQFHDAADSLEAAAEPEDAQESSKPSCLKCNTCDKRFTSVDFAQMHAARTGHDDFSESSEAVPVLTHAEKQQKLEELRARLAEKRSQNEELAKIEVQRNETIRRKAGKESLDARRALLDREAEKLAKERARDRREEQLLRERIKAQIDEDRARLKEKATDFVPAKPAASSGVEQQPIVHSDMVRLQVHWKPAAYARSGCRLVRRSGTR